MASLRSATCSTAAGAARRVGGPSSIVAVRHHQAPAVARHDAAAGRGVVAARRPLPVVRSAPDALAGEPEPDTAKEAIELGNKYAKASRWGEALGIYEKALTLPGTGLKRYRDRPRLISDGEKSAALFNIACCQSMLGDVRAGLVALSGCLELGYSDFSQLRADPDLAELRKDERFEMVLKRFEPKRAPGFFSAIFGTNK